MLLEMAAAAHGERVAVVCGGETLRVEELFAASGAVARELQASGAAHLAKLAAFADRYAAGLDPASAAAVRRFWKAWNGHPEADPIGPAWLEFARVRPDLLKHGPAWAAHLATLPDLAAGLVEAARNGV